MHVLKVASAAALVSLSAVTAHATALSFTGYTTSGDHTASIDLFQGANHGTVPATGFSMTDGIQSFVAWCFDLEHQIVPGYSYDYTATTTPYSNSYLLAGATDRAQDLFDAVYGSVTVTDVISAAAFQIALWEVAYDTDFSLTTGLFQISGAGAFAAQIETTAAGFLGAAETYLGGQNYALTFWEDTTYEAGIYPTLPQGYRFQNLVSAVPVPLPAAAPLMLAALGGLALTRRRAA